MPPRSRPVPFSVAPASRRVRKGNGFTLLEISLALAVMVVLVSLTWPAMRGYIAEQTLKEQAHIVRVELTRARAKAIDGGLTYQFRFEPGGRRFIVLPLDRPDVGSGSTADEAKSTYQVSQTPLVPVMSGQLPERCLFDIPKSTNSVTGIEGPAPTEQLPQEWLSLLPDGAELQQTSWSQAIRFFTDGSTDDGMITLRDEEDRRIDLTVRGLTGIISAGPLVKETRR